DNLDDLDVPVFVLGMKVKDKGRATAQLQRLENMLVPMSQAVPQLQGRVQSASIADHHFITLRLDGAQIPWKDILATEDFDEEEKKDVEEIREVIEPLSMMVCLGLYDDYLMLAIGDSTEVVSELGKGDLLRDTDELAPVLKLADKRVASVAFTSGDFT